ncbi:hypothetical protein LY76DRAFT_48001 [Colletotrichum caudatum]|nr:hypothetical protein LY76DRAFT_48001 [Colletotrichum caudatum]
MPLGVKGRMVYSGWSSARPFFLSSRLQESPAVSQQSLIEPERIDNVEPLSSAAIPRPDLRPDQEVISIAEHMENAPRQDHATLDEVGLRKRNRQSLTGGSPHRTAAKWCPRKRQILGRPSLSARRGPLGKDPEARRSLTETPSTSPMTQLFGVSRHRLVLHLGPGLSRSSEQEADAAQLRTPVRKTEAAWSRSQLSGS